MCQNEEKNKYFSQNDAKIDQEFEKDAWEMICMMYPTKKIKVIEDKES